MSNFERESNGLERRDFVMVNIVSSYVSILLIFQSSGNFVVILFSGQQIQRLFQIV